MLTNRPCRSCKYFGSDSRWDARILHFKCLAMSGAHNYHKNSKCMYCGVPPSDLSINVDIKHRGVLTWISDPSPISRQYRSVLRTYVAENEIVCWCYLMPFMFVCSVASRYVYSYIYIEGLSQYISSYWHHTFSDLSLEIYRVSDNRKTVNTSTVPTFLISWGRKCAFNFAMLIYRHDMRSGLQYVLIWMSFWIFLPRFNNFRDSLNCQSVGQNRLIEKLFLMLYKEKGLFQAPMWLC